MLFFLFCFYKKQSYLPLRCNKSTEAYWRLWLEKSHDQYHPDPPLLASLPTSLLSSPPFLPINYLPQVNRSVPMLTAPSWNMIFFLLPIASPKSQRETRYLTECVCNSPPVGLQRLKMAQWHHLHALCYYACLIVTSAGVTRLPAWDPLVTLCKPCSRAVISVAYHRQRQNSGYLTWCFLKGRYHVLSWHIDQINVTVK